ncbi:hypothetical protein IJ596_07515 [bacterium]|nr:hypothetical protein [bacterium]
MAIIDSISKVMGKASYTKPLKKLGNAFAKNPEKALGNAVVTSIILKDGIGCLMYVTQSLNNKRIPDEKRKFVAALDLTNGGLMILAQIAMFLAMRKYSGPLFKKVYNKSFGKLARFENIERFRMNAAKAEKAIAKRLGIEKIYDKLEKDGIDLFKFILDTSAATIIGKRVIVPLIATPFAKKVEKWMGKDANQNGEANSTTTPEPSMQGTKLDVTSTQSDSTNLLDKYKQNA